MPKVTQLLLCWSWDSNTSSLPLHSMLWNTLLVLIGTTYLSLLLIDISTVSTVKLLCTMLLFLTKYKNFSRAVILRN